MGSERVDLRFGPHPAATVVSSPNGTAYRPLLTLIVPAYNERDRIASSLATITAYLANAEIDYEVIAVNDGSTDGTAEVLEQLTASCPRLRHLSYPENRGKGYAVRSGVAAARGEYVMFLDADLTVPISVVDEFLRALRDGYDIAIASRRHPDSSSVNQPPVVRRLLGRSFSRLVRQFVLTDLGDTQCGGKAYRADVARRLFALQRIDHFSFDAEVIFLAVRAGYKVKEVPVALRYVPSSTIRPVRDSLLMLRDLIRIRLNASRGCYDK